MKTWQVFYGYKSQNRCFEPDFWYHFLILHFNMEKNNDKQEDSITCVEMWKMQNALLRRWSQVLEDPGNQVLKLWWWFQRKHWLESLRTSVLRLCSINFSCVTDHWQVPRFWLSMCFFGQKIWFLKGLDEIMYVTTLCRKD